MGTGESELWKALLIYLSNFATPFPNILNSSYQGAGSADYCLKEIILKPSTSCKILLHRYCGNFLYHTPFSLADPDLSFFLEPSNHFQIFLWPYWNVSTFLRCHWSSAPISSSWSVSSHMFWSFLYHVTTYFFSLSFKKKLTLEIHRPKKSNTR